MSLSAQTPPSTILPPRLIAGSSRDSLECSVHRLPKPLIREFRHVFGDKYLMEEDDIGMSPSGDAELLAIPTNQRALHDLVAVGDEIEREKDRLLNVFMSFGQDLCGKIRSKGFWADFIDPCSGLPMLTKNCTKVYSEVDGMEVLLNYRSYNAGFCKILTHPQWGSAVYPATIFCHAPATLVVELVSQYPMSMEAKQVQDAMED